MGRGELGHPFSQIPPPPLGLYPVSGLPVPSLWGEDRPEAPTRPTPVLPRGQGTTERPARGGVGSRGGVTRVGDLLQRPGPDTRPETTRGSTDPRRLLHVLLS